MKKLLTIAAMIFAVVAPAWGPTAKAQAANPIDVCAVPVHLRIGNLAMRGGWGRAHTFANEPGAFVGDIVVRNAVPRNGSENLALSGRGYVLVDCNAPQILHLRCAPGFWSCFQLTASRK